MSERFYVYILLRPNGDPFYVGKGIGLRIHDDKGRNQYCKNVILKHGSENIIRLYRLCETEQEAFRLERVLIWFLKEMCLYPMTNMTPGGEGGRTGLPHRAASIQKMKDKCKGRVAWNKGIPMSKEQKLKLGESRKGKKLSMETRKRMSESHKGRQIMTPELRLRLRTVHLGRKHTLESKKKMSLAKKGRTAWNKGRPSPIKGIKLKPRTAEVKLKISKAKKGKVSYYPTLEQKARFSEIRKNWWRQKKLKAIESNK